MFELWQKIEEKGAVAIPIRPEALSRLEWAEVAEQYPDSATSFSLNAKRMMWASCECFMTFVEKIVALIIMSAAGMKIVNWQSKVWQECLRDIHIILTSGQNADSETLVSSGGQIKIKGRRGHERLCDN